MNNLVKKELERRKYLWEELIKNGGPKNVEASLLRRIGFFSGQRGIYRAINYTRGLTESGEGVTLSVLHTGKHYEDDLTETEIIYHYPQTKRGGHDKNEIEATKNAGRLGLPIFVIIGQNNARDVKIGQVEDWDDKTKTFLITFIDSIYDSVPVSEIKSLYETSEFVPIAKTELISTSVKARTGQQKFKFHVIKRYGLQCAVCDINIPQLLQAAHIIPKKDNGSDDPRNGIVLCANHHIAFDLGLFSINPDNYALIFKDGVNKQALNISKDNLNHLQYKPHLDALKWRWRKFNSLK